MNTYSNRDEFSGAAAATIAQRLPAQNLGARRWISALMGAVIFVAGGFCGAAAVNMKPDPTPLNNPSELPIRVAERLQGELRLSAAQRDQIEQVIRGHQRELLLIRANVAPPLYRELSAIMEEISAVLTPDQRSHWRPRAEQRLETTFPLQRKQRERDER